MMPKATKSQMSGFNQTATSFNNDIDGAMMTFVQYELPAMR